MFGLVEWGSVAPRRDETPDGGSPPSGTFNRMSTAVRRECVRCGSAWLGSVW